MEGMKHAKGPWKYQKESDAYTHIVRGENNRLICQLSQETSGESEATARLIASAPELLTALVHQYEWVKSLYDLYKIDETKYPRSDLIVTERNLRQLIERAAGMSVSEVIAATARQEAER